MRAPLRPTANRFAVAAVLLLAAHQPGCMSQPQGPVGVVRVAVTMVPMDVGCIVLTATSSRTVTQQFDVMPGSSAVLMMPGVPTGAVTFSAAAFAGPCAMAGDINTATWVSDPVTVQVAAGMVADVSLVMHRNGSARVGVDFQDDATATCSDGIKNSTETDVDCGGANMAHICSRCADGKHCLVGHDCVNGVCTGGVCGTPSCTDGIMNGGESGVDCGGQTMCPRCLPGQGCTSATDCVTATCGADMRCAQNTASCNDGTLNGSETDVDCGGGLCLVCANGSHCRMDADCASSFCNSGICANLASCSDGVRDGSETDVDCGGPNPCPRCVNGQGCTSPSDCTTGNCGPDGKCAFNTASCNDGTLNGNETDVDCGGACAQCPNGANCRMDADCASAFCASGICANVSTCGDGVQDGNETDIDCGGSCPGCAFGGRCMVATDCFSGVCDPMRRRCLGSCTDGIKDGKETDVDCGFFGCRVGCANGQQCAANVDCASNSCVGGLCQPTTCNDGVRSGTETDVDCGGICRACAAGQSCHDGSDCFNGQCSLQLTCTATDTGCAIDGIFDSGETDLDCGGPCPPCAVGQRCLVNTDCQKPRACVGGLCTPTVSCTDGVQDGDETGVDCGGTSCLACPGARCRLDTECASNLCLHDSQADIVAVCSSLTCGDGVQDGTETDVDCGGGPTCHLCAVGQLCQINKDCRLGLCVSGVCNTCTDGFQDGDETGVDCGGTTCLACPGTRCRLDTDCASNVCLKSRDLIAAICASPTCGDGVQDGPETDVDCGGVGCNQCVIGQACQVNTDCLKGACLNGTCFPLTCNDGVQDGTETDIDCGGGSCPQCGAGSTCQTPADCTTGLCFISTCI